VIARHQAISNNTLNRAFILTPIPPSVNPSGQFGGELVTDEEIDDFFLSAIRHSPFAIFEGGMVQ
jgi:hypothetical protein